MVTLKLSRFEPGNCRWATNAEQRLNSRQARVFTHDGETKCLSDWCRQFGVNRGTARKRLDKMGMSFYEAMTAPGRNPKDMACARECGATVAIRKRKSTKEQQA